MLAALPLEGYVAFKPEFCTNYLLVDLLKELLQYHARCACSI